MIKLLDKLLSFVLITLMALMTIDIVWQIFSRFALASPSSWTEEVARFLLMWIGILGAAWAYRRHQHLGLSYLVEKQTIEVQRKLQIFSHLATLLFASSILLFGGAHLVQLTFELNQNSASLGIRMAYVYLVLPLSGILFVIYSLHFIHQLINTKNYSNNPKQLQKE